MDSGRPAEGVFRHGLFIAGRGGRGAFFRAQRAAGGLINRAHPLRVCGRQPFCYVPWHRLETP